MLKFIAEFFAEHMTDTPTTSGNSSTKLYPKGCGFCGLCYAECVVCGVRLSKEFCVGGGEIHKAHPVVCESEKCHTVAKIPYPCNLCCSFDTSLFCDEKCSVYDE